MFTCKRMKLNPYFTSPTKLGQDELKTSNCKTPRRKQEKISLTDVGNEFLYMTPKTQATKLKINKQNYIN